MRPMTPEQRGEVTFYVPREQHPAAPELVATVACGARALEITGDPTAARLGRDTIAVVARLLDAEQHLAALRRILAEAVVTADHLPDDGLTAGDLLHLLTGSGLDLTTEIEHAEALREAETLAGVG